MFFFRLKIRQSCKKLGDNWIKKATKIRQLPQHNPKIERKLKVAQLLATGLSKQAIADSEGLSRSTVHEWAKDPIVEAEVDRLRSEMVAATRQALSHQVASTAESVAVQLREYGERRRVAAVQLQEIASTVLEKVASRLATLSPDDITPRTLPSILQAAAEVLQKGADAEAEALGVNRLIEVLEAKGLVPGDDT